MLSSIIDTHLTSIYFRHFFSRYIYAGTYQRRDRYAPGPLNLGEGRGSVLHSRYYGGQATPVITAAKETREGALKENLG